MLSLLLLLGLLVSALLCLVVFVVGPVGPGEGESEQEEEQDGLLHD